MATDVAPSLSARPPRRAVRRGPVGYKEMVYYKQCRFSSRGQSSNKNSNSQKKERENESSSSGGMAARGTCPRTVRCASVAMTGCVVLLLGMCVCATAGKVADLDIPRHAQADDPTLQKAVDAYRQARTLDSQLKRSERAVERQTQQLRKELKQTKVAAASANTHAFRQEVRLRLLDPGSVSVCSRPCLRLAGLREIAPVRTRV